MQIREMVTAGTFEIPIPDVSHIETENDDPVDNLPSEKGQRLLVEPLYSTGLQEQSFLAAANVGIFSHIKREAIVPDMLLSLDVEIMDDWSAREHRSCFVWEFGKPPDVAVEIVSNKKGGETDRKLQGISKKIIVQRI